MGSKGRRAVLVVATALLVLCSAARAPALAAEAGGSKVWDQGPGVTLNKIMRGSMYDGAWEGGYSAAFWRATLSKGDRVTIVTDAGDAGDTPPCQLLFLPGQAPTATTPILNPTSSSREASHDVQRFEAVKQPGVYTLAMTNDDVFLSGPLQCLDAPAEKPFSFKVTVANRGNRTGREGQDRKGSGEAPKHTDSAATHVVAPGQSLWVIAQGLVSEPGSIAEIAFKVQRLWQLNGARIGSGDPNLIYPGFSLRLK